MEALQKENDELKVQVQILEKNLDRVKSICYETGMCTLCGGQINAYQCDCCEFKCEEEEKKNYCLGCYEWKCDHRLYKKKEDIGLCDDCGDIVLINPTGEKVEEIKEYSQEELMKKYKKEIDYFNTCKERYNYEDT